RGSVGASSGASSGKRDDRESPRRSCTEAGRSSPSSPTTDHRLPCRPGLRAPAGLDTMAVEAAKVRGRSRREPSNPMATITPTRPTTAPPPPPGRPPLHRITVDEYERIINLGALEDPSRIELIDGYMVDKMAKNPGHSYATIETYQALAARLPAGWSAR